jgi:hypothetical protein
MKNEAGECYTIMKQISHLMSDVVTSLKIQRLRWVGHVVRIEDNPVRKLTFQKPSGSRRKGRPK